MYMCGTDHKNVVIRKSHVHMSFVRDMSRDNVSVETAHAIIKNSCTAFFYSSKG